MIRKHGLTAAAVILSLLRVSCPKLSGQTSSLIAPPQAPAVESDVALGKPLLSEGPKYPKGALKNKIQGKVVLRLTVDKNGKVKRAEVVSGSKELADSAVRSAPRWQYVPYFRNGEPVEVTTVVSINFNINEGGQPDITATYKIPPSPPISGIAKPGSGVSAPRVVYAPDPKYSDEALQAKHEGVCVLSLIVGTDGFPNDIKVTRAVGMGLDEKAIEAVQKWRFLPARRGDVPVAVVISVEVQFRIP